MDVSCRYDEDRDVYELGAEVDGAFVAFVSIPGTTVQSRVAAIKSADPANTETAAA